MRGPGINRVGSVGLEKGKFGGGLAKNGIERGLQLAVSRIIRLGRVRDDKIESNMSSGMEKDHHCDISAKLPYADSAWHRACSDIDRMLA